MLFPTVEYGLFFLAAFAGAWGLRRHLTAHKLFLLAASNAFYAFWDWRFLPVLIGLSLLAALVARALEVADDGPLRGGILAVGVGASLFALALFKYLGFAAGYGHLRYGPMEWQPVPIDRFIYVDIEPAAAPA